MKTSRCGVPAIRLTTRVALAVVVALLGFAILLDNQRAWAADCWGMYGKNCYATAGMNIPYETGTGAKANWYLRTVIAPDANSKGFTNQNLWAYTNLTPGDYEWWR